MIIDILFILLLIIIMNEIDNIIIIANNGYSDVSVSIEF